MGNYDDPRLAAPEHRPHRWLPIAAAAVVALLVGLGVGYLLAGATEPEPAPPVAAPASPQAAPSPSPQPEAPPCLAGGQAGAAVLEQVELGVQAIGNLDPTALRQVLDRLQPLQAELEQAVASCYGGLSPAPEAGGPPN